MAEKTLDQKIDFLAEFFEHVSECIWVADSEEMNELHTLQHEVYLDRERAGWGTHKAHKESLRAVLAKVLLDAH